MHERPEDLDALQRLLDASHASGGEHLRSIFSDERRVDAAELCALLPGVQILNLATVTSRCRPLVAPVDGLFFRGTWYFGSALSSVRYRHLRARPHVSASHTRGEELAVLVHGRAFIVDLTASEHAELRSYYVETYGPGWAEWAAGAGAFYARIDAERMFTFRFAR